MTDPVVPRHKQWPQKLTASAAERHVSCHGSANLPVAIPGWVDPERKEGNAADIGTFVHDLMAQAATLRKADLQSLIEMMKYLANLRDLRRFKMLIEETQEIDWLSQPTKTTPDLVLYTQDEIHVVDWKNGRVLVDLVGNKQLLYYAIAVAHLAPKAKGVYIHVVQPNSPEWDAATSMIYVTTEDLVLFRDELIKTDKAITGGDVTLSPGDHCTFCPANPHARGPKGSPLCPAALELHYPGTMKVRNDLLNEEVDFFD